MVLSRPASRTVALVVIVVLAGCAGAPVADSPGDATPTQTPTTSSPSETPQQSVNGTLEVHFINVGQSVSTLVVSPEGETMLIDSGHYNDDGEYVLQYLQRHDITRIDHFVVSHNDADHIGGNAAVIDYYETDAEGIGAVYDPGIAASTQTYEAYLDAVEQHDVTLYETREGDSIPFEGVDTQVLGPPEPYLEGEARNENSIVLTLTFGQTSFLFTGDAEDDQEAYLVDEYGTELQATVMKAGHHGSASSTSGELLDAAQPKAVVISSAYDSQYGHPDETVLQRLADRSLPAYWTATHGDIVLVSDGAGVSVRTQAAAPTAPLELRDGEAVAPGTTGGVTERVRLGGEPVTSATATDTPVATDGGTTLAVAEINADASGDDRENLNDEYIVLENTGSTALDMGGWTVTDDADHRYTFPEGFTLEAGATVTLHTGSGTDTATELYWGAGSPIWNNAGDTITVRNSNDTVVLEETY